MESLSALELEQLLNMLLDSISIGGHLEIQDGGHIGFSNMHNYISRP